MLALGKGKKSTLPLGQPLPFEWTQDNDDELASGLFNLPEEQPQQQSVCTAVKVPKHNTINVGVEESEQNGQHICKKHKMKICDPAYDGHHPLSYYYNLWGNVTCVKIGCPNEGLTFGELIKKIKVHYCKECEEREGKHNCNHIICNVCMEKEMGDEGTNRRSIRRRN